MENVSGVYAIVHTSSGKAYVGSSKDIQKRLANHQKYLRLGTHANSYLQNAYNKYGRHQFNFATLEFCNEIFRIEREQFWIDQLQSASKEFGFNLSKKAFPTVQSDEGIKAIIESNKRRTGKTNIILDKDAWRAKISASRKGKPLSEKQRAALIARSIKRTGIPWVAKNPDAWRANISASRTGKKYGKRNPEIGKKISASLTGIHHSESRKSNISKAIMALSKEARSLRALKAWDTKRAKKEVL